MLPSQDTSVMDVCQCLKYCPVPFFVLSCALFIQLLAKMYTATGGSDRVSPIYQCDWLESSPLSDSKHPYLNELSS